MARFRVRCSDCGPVVVTSDGIEVITVPGRPLDRQHTRYAFTCTSCGVSSRRPVDGDTATKLILAGVPVRTPRPPAADDRPRHPEDPPDGPPITRDDILDLHLLLERDDWSSRLS